MIKQENRGGRRANAGRPKTNLKTYAVRCKPEAIASVRRLAKYLSNEENFSNS